jgi:hypothetical protein
VGRQTERRAGSARVGNQLPTLRLSAVNKLDQQDQAMASGRGRPMSDSGATARMYHDVCEQRLSRIVKVDLKSDRFTFDVDQSALLRTQILDTAQSLVLRAQNTDLWWSEMKPDFNDINDLRP